MSQAAREFFDRMAPEWDRSNQFDPEKVRAILRLADVSAGAKILDVACGTGVMITSLLELDPSLVRAVDISAEMVRLAQKKFNDPRVRTTEGDLYAFDETGFDLAVVYNAYPHFLDKQGFARSVRALLRPGGRLLIAHGRGRAAINGGHTGREVSPISTPLLPCNEEIARLNGGFRFDIQIDTESVYVLSGTAI